MQSGLKAFFVHRENTHNTMHCVLNPVVSASHHTPVSLSKYKEGSWITLFKPRQTISPLPIPQWANYCYKYLNTWSVTVKITVTCYISSVSGQLSQLHEPNNRPIIHYCSPYSTNNLP